MLLTAESYADSPADSCTCAQAVCGVAEDTLHQLVVDHGGDVAAVLASLCDSQSNGSTQQTTTTTAGMLGPHHRISLPLPIPLPLPLPLPFSVRVSVLAVAAAYESAKQAISSLVSHTSA